MPDGIDGPGGFKAVAARLAAVALMTIASMAIGACAQKRDEKPVEPALTVISLPEKKRDFNMKGQPPGDTSSDPRLQKLVLWAKRDLAARLQAEPEGVKIEAIKVVEARRVTWRDASLGCPKEGAMYTQALTRGVLIQLSAGKKTYRYHGAETALPFLCEQPAPGDPLPSDYDS